MNLFLQISLYTSLIAIILWIIYMTSFTMKKNFHILRWFSILIAFASFFLLLAMQLDMYETSIFHSILISIHQTIRLFVADLDYQLVQDYLFVYPMEHQNFIELYSILLFILGPLMTFGFVLSLFKNVKNHLKLWFGIGKDIYIFSELNEESLTLASSIREKNPHCMLIFTDVFYENNERSYEAIHKLELLKALYFKQDISFLRLPFLYSSAYFFLIGLDEQEKMTQISQLCHKYHRKDNAYVYLFSTTVQSDLLLTSIDRGNVKVIRVNPEALGTYQNLYHNGKKLFQQASIKDNNKIIHAVLIGIGGHGLSMFKSLCWLCQMDGYQLEIDIFDQNEDIEERLKAQCPGLFLKEPNGFIHFHKGIQCGSVTFYEELSQLQPTYILVALGEDELNVKVATEIRMLYKRMKQFPWIQAIVYNSSIIEALCNIKSIQGIPYEIDFTGDMKMLYSMDVILHSELEQEGLKIHKKWNKDEESSFWLYEYNYLSSVSTAVYNKVRDELDDVFADINKMEQRRWNYYMYTCGYLYSGSPEKSSKDDMAKLHNALVERYEDLNPQYDEINQRISQQKAKEQQSKK